MPYPAPVDVGAVTEVEWHLVCLPVDEAYKIAAWDAYTNLANRWMWGMDEPHADQEEIEQQWLNAIGLTMEEIGMSKLDTIIGHIDELEGLIRALDIVQCCDNPSVTFGPIEPIPDAGYGYEDSFPTTWGDNETIVDQDDYDEVLCAMAHRFVDYLTQVGENIDTAAEQGVAGVSALGTILSHVSGLGLVVVYAYAVITAIAAAIEAGWTTALFDTAGDAIEVEREAIVCAFLSGNAVTLEDAVEDEISALAFSLFYTHIDYVSAINAAQTGEWNGEFVKIDRDDSCDCGYEADVTFTFDTGSESWTHDSRSDWYDPGDEIRSHPKLGNPPDPTYNRCNRPTLAAKAGIGDASFYLDLITLDVDESDAPGAFAAGKEVWVDVVYSDDSSDRTVFTAIEATAVVTVNPAKEIKSSAGGGTFLRVGGSSEGSGANANFAFDNIRVAFHT